MSQIARRAAPPDTGPNRSAAAQTAKKNLLRTGSGLLLFALRFAGVAGRTNQQAENRSPCGAGNEGLRTPSVVDLGIDFLCQ